MDEPGSVFLLHLHLYRHQQINIMMSKAPKPASTIEKIVMESRPPLFVEVGAIVVTVSCLGTFVVVTISCLVTVSCLGFAGVVSLIRSG